MMKILKISIPFFVVLAVLIYFLDPLSFINVMIFFVVFHVFVFAYDILKKEMEIALADKYFPVFLKNLSRSVEVGIAPIKALIEISKEKYGEITKYFRVFKRKLEASVPIEDAFRYLENVFKNNRKIFTSLRVLSFELKSGYGLKEAIDSLYDFITKFVEVERERKVVISQFTVLFYAITLIVAAIIIILIKVLVPMYASFTQTQQSTPICINYGGIYSLQDLICSFYISEASLFKKEVTDTTQAYMFAVLVNLALIQAFFGGIIIGYGAEKSYAKGLIHALILFTIVFSIFLALGRIGFL